MTAEQQEKVEKALCWSSEIGCCSDKERYAFRIWDLFDELGISALVVPDDVVQALKDLQNWEECWPACGTVNAYLRELLEMDHASWERLISGGDTTQTPPNHS